MSPSKPEPPFPKQELELPGQEHRMVPRPQYEPSQYRGSDKLRDRVALITGGDSGIGRAVAVLFAREGAHVAFTHLPEELPDAQEAIEAIRREGKDALALAGDISDPSICNSIVETTIEKFGRLDVLINNAAFQALRSDITEIGEEEFERTYRINVFGMFYLCKAAMPHMNSGASIINTSSIQAYDPSGELLVYASTKAAIVNFTKGLSKTAIKRGIRVNSVAPGPVWTPLIPATMPSEWVESFGEATAFGRPAQPEEIAPLFVWLASDDASYVTGEVFGITGGKSPF